MEKTGPKVSCYGRKKPNRGLPDHHWLSLLQCFSPAVSSFPPDSLDTRGKSVCTREGRMKGRGRTHMKVDEASVPFFSQSNRSLCVCLCVRDLTGI